MENRGKGTADRTTHEVASNENWTSRDPEKIRCALILSKEGTNLLTPGQNITRILQRNGELLNNKVLNPLIEERLSLRN